MILIGNKAFRSEIKKILDFCIKHNNINITKHKNMVFALYIPKVNITAAKKNNSSASLPPALIIDKYVRRILRMRNLHKYVDWLSEAAQTNISAAIINYLYHSFGHESINEIFISHKNIYNKRKIKISSSALQQLTEPKNNQITSKFCKNTIKHIQKMFTLCAVYTILYVNYKHSKLLQEY